MYFHRNISVFDTDNLNAIESIVNVGDNERAFSSTTSAMAVSTPVRYLAAIYPKP